MSIDNGQTWEVTTEGFGIAYTPVSSVKVRNAFDYTLVMASSYGRGAWTSVESFCDQ